LCVSIIYGVRGIIQQDGAGAGVTARASTGTNAALGVKILLGHFSLEDSALLDINFTTLKEVSGLESGSASAELGKSNNLLSLWCANAWIAKLKRIFVDQTAERGRPLTVPGSVVEHGPIWIICTCKILLE
jgi:hypothetical protein